MVEKQPTTLNYNYAVILYSFFLLLKIPPVCVVLCVRVCVCVSEDTYHTIHFPFSVAIALFLYIAAKVFVFFFFFSFLGFFVYDANDDRRL